MSRLIVVSPEFMKSAAELAVGCCALAAGMVVMPIAAPVLGILALFGAKAVGQWIGSKPECEAAIREVLGQVSREFPVRHDANSADVRAAERALTEALKAENLFAVDRLREAWVRGHRLSEGLAALALESVVAHDHSFAADGLRRDLAQDVLERVFAAAVTCSVFREMATYTGVETTLGEVRAGNEAAAESFNRASHERQALADSAETNSQRRHEELLQDIALMSKNMFTTLYGESGPRQHRNSGAGWKRRPLKVRLLSIGLNYDARHGLLDGAVLKARVLASVSHPKDPQAQVDLIRSIADRFADRGRKDCVIGTHY